MLPLKLLMFHLFFGIFLNVTFANISANPTEKSVKFTETMAGFYITR